MAFRFRRSIRLAPGVRLNLGKRGASLSAGVRGASVSVGSRGTYANVRALGSGLSMRKKIPGDNNRPARSSGADAEGENVSVTTVLKEDGTLEFLDSSGMALSENLVSQAKNQNKEKLRAWLSSECDKINNLISDLETIHIKTPDPEKRPTYTPDEFTLATPVTTKPKSLGLSGRLFKSIRSRIESENRRMHAQYECEISDWKKAKSVFEEEQMERRRLYEELIYTDHEAMSQVFEEGLQNISWPRETNISFEVLPPGATVFVDVDLPEIEDMPTTIASLPARVLKVTIKKLTDTKIRQLYMNHVHAIGFRLVGEVFARLPTVNEVTLSAYSQRPDKATGHIKDEYLYSVKIQREKWSHINFENLMSIEIVDSLNQFEMRRNMTKTGVFKPIEPHEMVK